MGTALWEDLSLIWDEDGYQDQHLDAHKIYFAPFGKQPESPAKEVLAHLNQNQDQRISQSERDNLHNHISQDDLREGARGRGFQHYFTSQILPEPGGFLIPTIGNVMPRDTLPPMNPYCPVATPTPDLLYSYDTSRAFTAPQKMRLAYLDTENMGMAPCVLFPFLAFELEGRGPLPPGGMESATSRCAGNAVSCVAMLESLNQVLQKRLGKDATPLNTMAFSVACNGLEARIFATCKHEDEYHTYLVKLYALTVPDQLLRFRRYLKQILFWGMGPRLFAIGHALERLPRRRRSRHSPMTDPLSSTKSTSGSDSSMSDSESSLPDFSRATTHDDRYSPPREPNHSVSPVQGATGSRLSEHELAEYRYATQHSPSTNLLPGNPWRRAYLASFRGMEEGALVERHPFTDDNILATLRRRNSIRARSISNAADAAIDSSTECSEHEGHQHHADTPPGMYSGSDFSRLGSHVNLTENPTALHGRLIQTFIDSEEAEASPNRPRDGRSIEINASSSTGKRRKTRNSPWGRPCSTVDFTYMEHSVPGPSTAAADAHDQSAPVSAQSRSQA